MSFTCHIWEYPAPQHSAEVESILDVLHTERPGQNPLFLELARRLTARHPCITTLDDEEDAVWTDGPLDGCTDGAVYTLGILSQHLDTVYPFLTQTANDLGLVVYDNASGTVYRADGTILDFDPEAGAPRRSSQGVDLDRLREAVSARFAPIAQRHGLRRVGHHYVRGYPAGWQALAVRVKEIEGKVQADVSVDIYFHEVAKLYHALDRDRWGGDSSGRAFSLSVYELFDNPWKRLALDDPATLAPMLQWLLPLVDEKLLPMAAECDTLAGLDAVMNTGRTKFRHYPLNHLIVSRLLCSPRFDALRAVLCEGLETDEARTALGVRAQVLATIVRCNDTFFVSSYGPEGPSHGIVGPGRG